MSCILSSDFLKDYITKQLVSWVLTQQKKITASLTVFDYTFSYQAPSLLMPLLSERDCYIQAVFTTNRTISPVEKHIPIPVLPIVIENDGACMPFLATFDLVICQVHNVTRQTFSLLLKNLMNYVKPEGYLFFVGLGEGSFWQWTDLLSDVLTDDALDKLLVDQSTPPWRQCDIGHFYEEWLTLPDCSLEFVEDLLNSFIAYKDKSKISPRSTGEKLIQENKVKEVRPLTLHLLFGCVQKKDDRSDE